MSVETFPLTCRPGPCRTRLRGQAGPHLYTRIFRRVGWGAQPSYAARNHPAGRQGPRPTGTRRTRRQFTFLVESHACGTENNSSTTCGSGTEISSTFRQICHTCPTTSTTENCVAVIARTYPNEQESVVLLPDLETLVKMQ
jgi:hypothetical protein